LSVKRFGFPSPAHFSILHSERVSDAIEQWGLWFSKGM